MRKFRRPELVAVLLIAIALVLSTVSFAASAGTGTVGISVPAGSETTGGKIAKVEWMGESITRPQGNAAKLIAGVDLFKVTLAEASLSDRIRLTVAWQDPDSAGQVLNNPNSFIRMRTYYQDDSCTSADQRIVDDGGEITVCPTTAKEGFDVLHFTKSYAYGILSPTQAGQTTLYILGDIVVPGGVPPGQQSQLSSLNFWASASSR